MSLSEEQLLMTTLEQIEKRAVGYFGDASGEARLEVIRAFRREASRLWFIDVSCQDSVLQLAVKKQLVPAWERQDVVQSRRYRVAATPPVAERTRREGQTLRTIEGLMRANGDPRVGAVHVYDILPEECLLVMGRTAGAELGNLLLRASRRGAGPTSSTLLSACCNAGVWLRKFHDGMPQAGTSPVANDRDEFRRISDQKISEIERWSPSEDWWMALRESIERGLDATPEAFSRQATAHGDFWGGNVLCQPDGQVVVIDSFGVGRSPVYVDLAYFLLHLHTTSAQIFSRGLWCSENVPRECESAFLEGYDARCPPVGRPLVLFQILVLLYKWAASIGRLEERRGLERVRKRVTFASRSRYFRQLIDGYVARLG